MDKIAYIIDSSCFMSKDEAEALDLYYVPIHILIEGEDFKEGVDLDKNKLIEALAKKKNVSTSQPSPGEIIELINMLKDNGYTKAVFSSIGKGLSATADNVSHVAKMEDFDMHVLNSRCLGNTQKLPLLKVRKLVEEDGKTIDEAFAIVDQDIMASTTLLVPNDLFHLSRGGRITPAAAALGSMLKIKPILDVSVKLDGKIDVIDKVRTEKKAYAKLLQLALNDEIVKKSEILVAHFDALPKAEALMAEIKEKYPEADVRVVELPAAIGVHTGLDSIGLQVFPKN